MDGRLAKPWSGLDEHLHFNRVESITIHHNPSQSILVKGSFNFFISLFTSTNLERLRDAIIAAGRSPPTQDIRTTLQDRVFALDEPPEIVSILASYCDRADLEITTICNRIFWLRYHADLFEAWEDACEEARRENSPLKNCIRHQTQANRAQGDGLEIHLRNYIVSILYPHDPNSEAAHDHFVKKLEFSEKVWTLHNELDIGIFALIAAKTTYT